MTRLSSAHQAKSFHRPALSPFLYDLGAATRALPPAAVLPEQFHGSPVNANAARFCSGWLGAASAPGHRRNAAGTVRAAVAEA